MGGRTLSTAALLRPSAMGMKVEGACLSSAHRIRKARQRQAKLGPVRIGANERKLPAVRDR